MRILALSIIILASFYALFPGSKEGPEIDDIKVRLSAPKRKEAIVKKLPPKKNVHEEVAPDDEAVLDNQAPDEYSETDISFDDGEGQLTHMDEASASGEHEKGWQDELSQILLEMEPEFGEEIFNSYVHEQNTYQSSLDELIRAHQKSPDLEVLINELEIKHEDRAKEIFGRHYEEIRALELKFLESGSP